MQVAVQFLFACDPDDTVEVRSENLAIFLLSTSCVAAGLVWTLLYLAVFGWGYTAFLPLLFVLILGLAILVSHLTRTHPYAVYAQIVCIVGITALIQWSTSGVFGSGWLHPA